MKKSEVISIVAKKAGINKSQANAAIFALFNEIHYALLAGDIVNLNEIGKFSGELTTKNEKTSLSVKFSAGKHLTDTGPESTDGIPF